MQPSFAHRAEAVARSLILPAAEADIVEIFEYHLDHSDQTANEFADAVIEVVLRLEQFPESGSPRSDVLDGLRVVPMRRFKTNLYYVSTADSSETLVTVFRVLRQERSVSEDDFL